MLKFSYWLLACLCTLVAAAHAQAVQPEEARTYVWAMNPVAPYVIEQNLEKSELQSSVGEAETNLRGFDVLLLKLIDERMPERFEFRILRPEELHLKAEGLSDSGYDALGGAITRSAERLKNPNILFSDSYHRSEVRLATRWDEGREAGHGLIAFFSSGLEPFRKSLHWSHLLFMVFLIFLGGLTVKIVTSKKVKAWQAGVMLFFVFAINNTYLTAMLVTALRVQATPYVVGLDRLEDLATAGKPVAVKATSPSVEEVEYWQAEAIPFASVNQMCQVASDPDNDYDIELVAHDWEILNWEINRNFPGRFKFILDGFGEQFYAFMFRPDIDPDFVRRFNIALAEVLEDKNAQARLRLYLPHEGEE
ncbi:MAG: transporter substrate-binding domain-containing protein [Bdellovibrionales bacterium]|nr:transporter substrate-binding domain-containing protein [Bdellovibrionales bacterium]